MSKEETEVFIPHSIWKSALQTFIKQGPTVILLAVIAYVFWIKAESSNQRLIDLLLMERVEMKAVIQDNTEVMEQVIFLMETQKDK